MSEAGHSTEQVEAGLLFLVLDLDPEHLSVVELEQRMTAHDPCRREAEIATVTRAVEHLRDVGLLGERNGKIVPTRAAQRFNALYI